MKTSLAVIVVGLMGLIVGSLAAQQPGSARPIGMNRGVIYEGPMEIVRGGDDHLRGKLNGDGRVYDGWIVLNDELIIPRDTVQHIVLQKGGRFDDFGDQPDADPNAVPDPNPNTSPKRRPFRED